MIIVNRKHSTNNQTSREYLDVLFPSEKDSKPSNLQPFFPWFGVRLPGRSVGNLLNNSNFSLTLCQQANQLSIVLLGWLGLIQKRRPSAGTSLSFRSRKRFLQGNANVFTVELVNAFRRCHVDRLGQRPVRFCLKAVTPQRKRAKQSVHHIVSSRQDQLISVLGP